MELLILSFVMAWVMTRYGVTDLVATARGTESPRIAERRQRAAQSHERQMARLSSGRGPGIGEAIGARIADRIAHPRTRDGQATEPGPARRVLGEVWGDAWARTLQRHHQRQDRAAAGQLPRQRAARTVRDLLTGTHGKTATGGGRGDTPPDADDDPTPPTGPDQHDGDRWTRGRDGDPPRRAGVPDHDGIIDAEIVTDPPTAPPTSTDPAMPGPAMPAAGPATAPAGGDTSGDRVEPVRQHHPVTCPTCTGWGVINGGQTCPTCAGDKWVPSWYFDPGGAQAWNQVLADRNTTSTSTDNSTDTGTGTDGAGETAVEATATEATATEPPTATTATAGSPPTADTTFDDDAIENQPHQNPDHRADHGAGQGPDQGGDEGGDRSVDADQGVVTDSAAPAAVHHPHDPHDPGASASVPTFGKDTPTMTAPTDTHNMPSGEIFDPSGAIAFVEEMTALQTATAASTEQAAASLREAGVSGRPVELLDSLLEQVQQVIAACAEAKGYFEAHRATQDQVLSDDTLAGTVAGTYVGNQS